MPEIVSWNWDEMKNACCVPTIKYFKPKKKKKKIIELKPMLSFK